jgi:hypothetical protein
MPRRKGTDAQKAATGRRRTQWRYLLRNPDFQNLINHLLDTYDLLGEQFRHELLAPPRGHDADVQATGVISGVAGLRKRLNLGPPSDGTLRRMELQIKAGSLEEKLTELCKGLSVYLVDALRRGRGPLPGGYSLGDPLPKLSLRSMWHYEALVNGAHPVSVIEDCDGETVIGPEQLRNPHTLYLEIELAYPRDVLLAFIEKILSSVVEERGTKIKRDPNKRQRSDKADFEIGVYDQVLAGETFPTIAARLRRPVSSVKSAYLAACWNIFGSAPPRRKRDMPLVAFDFANHVPKCEICKHAERPEEFCAPARAYINQDYVSLKELPVGGEPHMT